MLYIKIKPKWANRTYMLSCWKQNLSETLLINILYKRLAELIQGQDNDGEGRFWKFK